MYACSTPLDQRLLGYWEVNDAYHTAVYEILEMEGEFAGRVRYYDDGTSTYTYNQKKPLFLFRSLHSEQNSYVDGMSGATKTGKESKTLSISVANRDTLQVTRYIGSGSRKETWTRTK